MNVRQLRSSDPRTWLPKVLSRLAAAGPVTTAELAASVGVGEDEVELALRTSARAHEADEGWVDLLTLAEGAVFTHFLTSVELEEGVLTGEDDLALWVRLAEDGLPLSTGGTVGIDDRIDADYLAETVLTGPDGWLNDFSPDDLISVRLSDGCLTVERFDLGTAGPYERLPQVVEAFRTHAMSGLAAFAQEPTEFSPFVDIDEIVADLLAADRAVFAEPLPPLRPLLQLAKLEVADGAVSLRGAPDEAGDVENLSYEEIVHLTMIRGILGSPDSSEDDLSLVVGVLADSGDLLERAADEAEEDPLPEEIIAGLRRTASTGVQKAVALLLAARTAEGSGDPRTAAGLIDEVLAADPDNPIALVDAAEYAACRGDLVRADSLLRRWGGPPGQGLRHTLRPLLAAPAGTTGRNQPCPCGSGQKYKKCCLGKLHHPLPARAVLLYHLLLLYSQRPAQIDLLVDLIEITENPGLEPAFADLAAIECLDAFLAERGDWFRGDERALLETWRDTPLRLWEVVSVRLGEATVRPLPGGDPVVLRDRLFSQHARPLDLALTRLLDDGTGPKIFGSPFRIDRMRRPHLLALLAEDPGPYEIARFFGPQPMPHITNREGHDLVICSARYDVGAASWQALAERLGQGGPDELIAKGDDDVVRGTIRRDGPRWTIETNSVERLRELQELLRSVAPDARQIDESSVPIERALRDAPASADPGLPPEQTAEIMEEFIQNYERSWVDQSIPALGGLTPREAVARGGAARADLDALLDDFEWSADQPQAMSAARIRRLLGI
ncbi:SEC-C metal-binding domain-containing protein [Sphaerimonospora thailandensis]|uniref:SEC-C motif-containing protein n=1 Tax=Sphaerimonospora thailandensis TaxID=795644 RepID=A0A8J3R5Z2_9ACTN|nr:SEC-C metal-binding domain-containing protein [Sphaerimonospora thailandensis]GIH68109.1 hypothetical protein Mth01_03620 [Sphaerimonospora thailandensis]